MQILMKVSMTHSDSMLDELDDLLGEIRRVFMTSSVRNYVLSTAPRDADPAIIRVLRAVQRMEAEPSIGEIADVLGIDPSTASRVVENANRSGYLGRHRSGLDRRRTRLELTPLGLEVLTRVTERRREVLRVVTDGWGDSQLTQLVASLEKLKAGFDRFEPAP